MSKVYIYGHRGNMGTRYKTICQSLGHEVGGWDVDGETRAMSLRDADAIIVATPTASHADILHSLRDCGRPVLCEKPLTKSLTVLEELLWAMKKAGTRIAMVNQYAELDTIVDGADTYYNCFRHGQDGLYWDCISLVRLARGPILLKEDSPVWQCTLNGRRLELGEVDKAYVAMLDRWLKDPTRTDYDELWAAHKKVADLEAAACRRS